MSINSGYVRVTCYIINYVNIFIVSPDLLSNHEERSYGHILTHFDDVTSHISRRGNVFIV